MSSQKEISKILKELSLDELDVLVRKAQFQKKLKQDPYMNENRERLLEAHKGYWKDDRGKKRKSTSLCEKLKRKGKSKRW